MNAVIALDKLERRFGANTILKGLDAQVMPGQVIALLGKNGAGKTTLLETLLGFGWPSAGQADLWGAPATQVSPANKQRIGFVPQQDELLPSLTGAEHLRLFAAFRTRWNQALVDRLVVEWQIPTEQTLSRMSIGQRQKLSILLAIAHEPELLVLDEPVASLDPIARRQFLQQLVDMAADEQRSIIFSTHIVSDVERVANRVWMLREGELVYQGELDQLKESMARVNLRAEQAFEQVIEYPHLLQQKRQGRTAQLTFSQWQPEWAQDLARRYGAQVEVERLSLEDIFLELNS